MQRYVSLGMIGCYGPGVKAPAPTGGSVKAGGDRRGQLLVRGAWQGGENRSTKRGAEH